MPPKFESSFIPKGSMTTSTTPGSNYGSTSFPVKGKKRTVLGFIAGFLFTISILTALAVFGYKFYLNYSIENMKIELEAGRASLETETVAEILRFNNRLLASETLVNRHLVVSPLFRFLDTATVKTVRFNDFNFSTEQGEQKVNIKGEAKNYAALALQADLLNKSDFFTNPVFSDLRLDDKGNVEFSFTASVNTSLLSYKKEIEKLVVPVATSTATSTRTTTSTSTPSTSSGQATTTTPR